MSLLDVKVPARPSLEALVKERILVLDGAMGSLIHAQRLSEEQIRGERFRDHQADLSKVTDLVCVTNPHVIEGIHGRYLEAGADIIETNSFNATSIGLADLKISNLAREINLAAAGCARRAADAMTARTPNKPRYVAGSIGPLPKMLTLNPEDPTTRPYTFDQVAEAYYEQAAALMDGGVDLLLPETVFDSLNLKACLYALAKLFEDRKKSLPVMASVTIFDGGVTLTGQQIPALWAALSHFPLFSVGINCALGPDKMRPFLEELANTSPLRISCYPNAGLPNALGEFDATPESLAHDLREFAENGWLSIVGGCCGTTPDHIHAIANAVKDCAPRTERPDLDKHLTTLSGTSAMELRPDSNFLMIGERTNISGSRKYARLIKEKNYEAAVEIAREQVENGANVIDVNVDDGLIDGVDAMTKFLWSISESATVSRVPVMIDSSKFDVIEAGLKCVQGKPIANSISLKEGEEVFIKQATKLKHYGAAVVVMAFDETGQAVEVDDKVRICQRAYKILIERVGFRPEDIVFDPNILTVATGMEEHNNYAVNFIEATRLIKEKCPGAKISGGVSNISFSFRGNDVVREAMHSVFLYHAIRAGLDMGIVNPSQLAIYEDVDPVLRDLCEDVILNRRPDATERLLAHSETVKQKDKSEKKTEEWRNGPIEDRLSHALCHGLTDYLEPDLEEARLKYKKCLSIIEGPLMAGMSIVGELFGAGKMFLPQVVKSARVMKKAVAYLMPYMEQEKLESGGGTVTTRGRVLLATVKGDVHDIGKNIVGVVLQCNNYEIVDLGVMVPCEKILATAKQEGVHLIGLSGLITPSLDEMVHVASEMERQGFDTPLLIGGATTSSKHTAVKIAPKYSGAIVHVLDASRSVGVVDSLLSPERRDKFVLGVRENHAKEAAAFLNRQDTNLVSYASAKERRYFTDWATVRIDKPEFLGTRILNDFPLADLVPYIDWSPFFMTWELKGKFPKIFDDPVVGPEAKKLYDDARAMLDEIISKKLLTARGVYGFFPANSIGDDIAVYADESRTIELGKLHTLRQQWERKGQKEFKSLADYIAPVESGRKDYVGAFVVTAGHGCDELAAKYERDHDDYSSILVKALADRLAEAFAERLHADARLAWGYGREETLSNDDLINEKYRGIRPAPGYPACPDHTEKTTLFNLLDAEKATGVKLTESYAMYPGAAVSGFYFAHPEARYFTVDRLTRDQIENYAARKGVPVAEVEKWLAPNLGY